MTSVQNPRWLFYREDEILPTYMGIVISQYKDPYEPIWISWNVMFGYCSRCSLGRIGPQNSLI